MIKSKWLTVHWREGLWVNNDLILVFSSHKAIVWLVIETAFMIFFSLFWSTDSFSPHLLYSSYMEKYNLNNLLCSTNESKSYFRVNEWHNFHFRVNYLFKTEMELGKMFKMHCILLRHSRLLPLRIGWLFEVCKAGLWVDTALTGRRSLFLKPHWCDWVSMATWAQSLAWDKFRVERGATSIQKLRSVCLPL